MALKQNNPFKKSNLIHPLAAPLFILAEPVVSIVGANRLIVLFAHLYPDQDGNINHDLIRNNLKYLVQECNVLPLREAMNSLDRNHKLPRRAVAIVVDDATKAFEQVGRKLLKEVELPYTLAIIPGLIQDSGKENQIARLMRLAGHEYWLPNQEMLRNALAWFGSPIDEGAVSFELLFEKARQLEEDQFENLLLHVRAQDHHFMSWEELKQLQAVDQVDFASHTMSHPRLKLATGTWLDWEIGRSKELIQSNLGIEVDSLVAPYGNPENFTADLQQALVKYKYKYAFSTEKGTIGSRTKRHQLPRLNLEDEYWRLKLHTCPAVCSFLYSGGSD
ncbi:MAG: polysaccharide deacetylase family protein [Anaerolineales bacterium]|nr:polysaccharide deacetylase family protein [Anaerolineales bacterium]